MIIDTKRLRSALRKHMRHEYKVNAPRCYNAMVAQNLLAGLEDDLERDLKTLTAAERLSRELKVVQKELKKFEREIKEGKR